MALAIAFSAPLASAQVTLRGGERLENPVLSVSLEGVQLGGVAPRLISWDLVKEVEGAYAAEAERYRELAEAVWRARWRLARGDVTMALPLFEQLFETYRGVDGPTALIVAEGLLQCRLATLAQPSAVEPWLEAVRLRRQIGTPSTSAGAMHPLDAETLLAPQLPPIWLESAALAALAQDSTASNPDPVVRRLAELYIAGAAMTPHVPPSMEDESPAAALVKNMIQARAADPAARAEARQWLRAGLASDAGTWREAWRRAAIGQSLLMEDSPDDRRLGMIHLLHLPARFKESQRYLTGVALALVANELRRQGDIDAADRLTLELVEFDAAHPARQWLERQPTIESAATAGPIGAHKETL